MIANASEDFEVEPYLEFTDSIVVAVFETSLVIHSFLTLPND